MYYVHVWACKDMHVHVIYTKCTFVYTYIHIEVYNHVDVSGHVLPKGAECFFIVDVSRT